MAQKETVLHFIYDILVNTETFFSKHINNDGELKNKIINKTIDVCNAWVKFNLNLLMLDMTLIERIFSQINTTNVKLISDLLCESISNTQNANIYSKVLINNDDNDSEDIFHQINQHINQTELSSIYKIISLIQHFSYNYIINTTTLTNLNDILTQNIMNILSTITENYVYLFFLKTEISQQLFDMLYYYISFPKKSISSKFLETICEMRDFVDSTYHLGNLTDTEKTTFITYLLKLNEAMMIHCKLKSLDVGYDFKLRQTILCLNDNDVKQFVLKETTNVNDIEDDPFEITVTNYREQAVDVFYNIFLMLVSNFGERGVHVYIDNVMNILTTANIDDESVLTNTNSLLVIESALFVMKSITNVFECDCSISNQHLINFTQRILKSKLLSDKKMIVSFILYVDSASACIARDKQTYHSTIAFLLKMSKDKVINRICSLIIYNIAMFLNAPDVELFKLIYQCYEECYDEYKDNDVIVNLALALCHCVYPNDNDDNKTIMNDELYKYFMLIMKPATERIKKLYEFVHNGRKDKLVLLEISKNYAVHEQVIHKAKEINKELFYMLFDLHFKETFTVTNIIFIAFVHDTNSNIVNELVHQYIKYIQGIYGKTVSYFDTLSGLMLNTFQSNPIHYKCLSILKYLLHDYITAYPHNNINICEMFFTLTKQICYNILHEAKDKVDMLMTCTEFFTFVFPKLNVLNIDQTWLTVLNEFLDLFVMGLNELSERELIVKIIKAMSCFVGGDMVDKAVVEMKMKHISVCVFNAMNKFDSACTCEFVCFVSNVMNVNKQCVFEVVKEVLGGEKFGCEYIKVVCEYLERFGDSDVRLQGCLSTLVDIVKGKGKVELLNFFAMEIARKKINENKKN